MKTIQKYLLIFGLALLMPMTMGAQTLDQVVGALLESEVNTTGFAAQSTASAQNQFILSILTPVLNNVLAASMQETDLTTFTSAVFNFGGECLMDELYLMMEITESAGLGMTGHVVLNYWRNETGTAYNCINIWDAENDRINLTSKAGKKLYFTGTANNVSGRRTSLDGTDAMDFYHEGFIYLEGSDDDVVDLYLHNYRVLSVQDREWQMTFGYHGTECTKNEASMSNSIFGLLLQNELLLGMGCPFAFANNTASGDVATPMHVNFHIMGNNLLQGGAQSSYSQESMDLLSGPAYACVDEIANNIFEMPMVQLTALFNNLLTMTASPIAVRPTFGATKDDFNNSVVYFTFDDIWVDGLRKNGLLELPVNSANPGAPSIDYGNELGQVVFNGGQYKLHTPGNDNLFSICNMAICYRTVEMSSDYASLAEQLNYPGVGSSIGTGRGGESQLYNNRYKNVIINNGTFTAYDASAYKSIVDVKAKGWYNEYTDLRLPYNSRVLGGNFTNCDLYRCNSAAEKGKSMIYITNDTDISATHDTIPLCRTEVDAKTMLEDYVVSVGTNGTLVKAPIGDESNKSDVAEFQISYTTEGGTTGTYQYGAVEMIPEVDGDELLVNIYSPGTCKTYTEEDYITNYVSLIPELGADNRFVTLTMGGDVEVLLRNQGDEPRTTGYLLQTHLNEYTVNYGKVNMGTVPVAVKDVLIDKTQDVTHLPSGEVLTKNNVDYTISYGIYLMQSFKSNEWALISMPFDVDNIFVMETSTAAGNASWTDAEWESYFQAQGEADGNVLTKLLGSLFPGITSKAGSGVLQPFVDLVQEQGGAELFNLVHYNPDIDGHGADMAHFYLYEMQNDGSESLPDNFVWDKKSEWKEFSNKEHWLPATYTQPSGIYYNQYGDEITSNVLMKKGIPYALYLPDNSGKKYWDYKYLIFQGRGPQKIKGHHLTDFNSGELYSIMDDLDYAYGEGEELVMVQGNNTFSIDTLTNISSSSPVYLAESKKEMSFIFEKYYATDMLNILPCEVYVATLGDILKAEMPHKADQTNMTSGNEQLPQVGNISLRAWQDNGITLFSLTEQTVTVCSMDGRQLWQGLMHDGQMHRVPVSAGIYIVHGDTETMKMLIK